MDTFSAELDHLPQGDGRTVGDDDVKIQDVAYQLPAGRPPLQDDCVLHGALPADRHQHIVEFVRGRADKFTERCHLLCLNESLLK